MINCEKDLKYIKLIGQEYFILFLKDKYLIYKINQEDKYPQFEFIKNLPHKYNNIYTVQNKFAFVDKSEIAFYEFNKEKIDFELLIKFAHNSKDAIKIDDMNNNKILIKYFKGEEKYVLNKYQIYDIKSQKQLHLIEFNTGPFNINTLFLWDKYLLEISFTQFILKDYETLKELSSILVNFHGNEKSWDVYKDEKGVWYILYYSSWYKLNNNKIELIKELEYPDFNLKKSCVFKDLINK